MSQSDTSDSLQESGRRPWRKRAPVCPGWLVDQSVSGILQRSQVPLSAYDLVARVREDGLRITVTAVYRSLDRLCLRQQVEKVEMVSAYRIKDRPKALLMICMGCGRTTSLSVASHYDAMIQLMMEAGFSPDRVAIEASGICRDCGRGNQRRTG